MPLLNRKPFSSDPPPSDLSENEEIFVCRQTNEVYRDYESFFKRTILCNSLVWSCKVTLKHSLTYEEALDSEQEAQKVVDHVSTPIQQGVLTLVHYTRHSRLDNLCDEVYNYIRDRYQEGEEIEVKYKGEKFLGYIHKVIEPNSLTNGFGSNTSSPLSKQNATKKIGSPHIKNKSGKSSNLSSPNKPGGSIIVLSDDENQSNNKEKTPALPSPSSPKASSTWPDSKRYQYEVRLKDNKNTPVKTPESITAKYSDISRKKRTFSRDKLKLLLRVTCCRSTALSDDGYWRVKDKYRKKFDLSSDVDLMFQNMPVKKKNKKRKSDNLAEMNGKSDSKKRKKSEEKDKKKKSEGKEDKSIKDKNKKEKMLKKMSPEEIEKYKLEMKIQQEKKKEERKREKDVQREVKKKEREKERQEKRELLREQRLSLLHWCIPQEDLDLGDLKELPIPVPVQCKFSGDMFGSIVMVLEFLHTFGEFFEMKQDFPDGVSIEMLEEALQEHDAEGMFYDILKFLLQCILKTHAEEEEEEGLDDSDVQAHDETEDRKMEEEDEEESDLTRLKKAVSSSASMAAAWAQLYQGKNLHELTLDPFTCSEILRLHILSSGARLVSGSDGDTYRWQRRGGFTFADDAGVAFRHHEHGIMRALVTNNVYDLDTADKLKILSTLCSQLLTYATTRDIIDDGIDRSKKAKRELQEEQWADQRKDKEEAAAKYRKRVEEKAKEREDKEKKLTESKSETPENSKEKIPKQESSNQEDEQTLKELEEDNLSKAITRSQAPPVAEEEMANDENEEERERETRKEQLKKREKSFLKEIRRSQAMSGLQPIGIDRGFRRYWLFSSINGLFIEDNDSELNKLLQLKVNDELSEEDGSDGDSSVSENLGENALGDVSGDIEPLSNSKESSNIPPTSSCSLTKTQIQEEKELSRILKLYSIPLESLPENSPLSSQAELGEKREENCEKLMTRNIAQWSYLDKKEDFDKLIDTLNPRGIREKSLREALVQHYKMIVNGLNENPVRVENHERNEALQQQIRARKKRAGLRNQPQGVNKTLYKSMEDFIEANLRDQILDLEDRIWQGGLGSVKTEDITAWRKKVENCIYDFIPAAAATETPNEESKISVNGMDVDGQESETMEVDEKKEAKSTVHEESLNTKTCKLNILPSFENSRPGTPVDGSFASTPTTSHTPQAINPYVRLLAKAVLEVEQGIERKYLIPPLGDDEETKKRKQQESSEAARMEFDEMMVAAATTAAAAAGKKKKDKIAKNDVTEAEKQENGNNDVSPKTEQIAKQQKTLLERWEDSLMASTNLSQVFIHLTNLDNCISWNKSVLNARCRICRRKGDAEHMLLCDGCDRGHHMYCLKPPIKEIPEGDWFCSDCRPKEPRRSFRKTRKVEESDEESGDEDKTSFKREEVEESNSDEDEDDDSSEEEEEDSVEESDDEEDEEVEEDEEMDEVEGSEEEGSVHMETCACCDGGGELLCCETCPLAYHLECAYPPLRRVPRGSWACQVCTGADSELPAGRKIKKSVIKTAQKRVNDREIVPKVPTKTSKTSTKEIATKKVVKKPTTLKPKLQTSNTNTPSPVVAASQSRKTLADVRINKRKIATPPQASSTPSGQSNSAPKRTGNGKWPGQVKMCRKLLKELTEHEDSWPFLYPVDQTEVPDYSTIVKTPMDLKTVDGKLSSRQYHCVEDFAADVRQIFFNCAEYNKPRTREARAGVRLSALFETRFGELGLDASDNKPSRTRRSR